MMIEALIAILIFCLGILGMVAMGGAAIGAQSDANTAPTRRSGPTTWRRRSP